MVTKEAFKAEQGKTGLTLIVAALIVLVHAIFRTSPRGSRPLASLNTLTK
jgi:hypothetical protein